MFAFIYARTVFSITYLKKQIRSGLWMTYSCFSISSNFPGGARKRPRNY